jgi:hypothetical protein
MKDTVHFFPHAFCRFQLKTFLKKSPCYNNRLSNCSYIFSMLHKSDYLC